MCAHILHPALEIVNVLKGLNNAEDAGGGACGNESVRGSPALSPALLLSPDIAASFGKSEVL